MQKWCVIFVHCGMRTMWNDGKSLKKKKKSVLANINIEYGWVVTHSYKVLSKCETTFFLLSEKQETKNKKHSRAQLILQKHEDVAQTQVLRMFTVPLCH